ncbi:adhesive domain-containing protein, partial [Culicoidibacter larvae]
MKKIVKIITSMLLAAIVAMQADLSVFAFSNNNQASETNTVSEENTSAQDPVSDENLDADVEAESETDQPTVFSKISSFSIGFASFDGVDLSGNTSISKELGVIAGTPSEFNIQASFSGDTDVNNRKIVIAINDSLTLAGAPGLTGSGATWTFNESLLPTDLQGRIIGAEFISNGTVYGQQIGSGVLTYDVAPGVTNILVPVKIKFDLPFAVFTGSRDFADVLSVKTTQDVNSVTTIVDEETLENFTITDTVGMGARLYSAATSIYGEPGKLVTITYDFRGGFNTYSDNGGYLFEEQTYKFYIDKRAGVESVDFSLPNGTGTYSIDSTTNATKDILYITLKEIAANGTPKVTIKFTPTVAAQPGDSYLISANAADSVTKPYKSNVITTNIRNGVASQYRLNIASPFENKIAVYNNSVNVAQANYMESSIEGINFIGAIDLRNPQSQKVTNQLVRFTFDSPDIGVKAVDLPSSLNVDVKNVVVKTNKGNTFTIDSAAVSPGYGGTGTARYRLNLKALGVTDADEYITEVTYLVQELTASYATIYSNLGGIDSGIYGTVLSMPTSKSWSFQIATVPLNDGDFDGANAKTAISTTKFTDLPIVFANNQTIPANNLAGNSSTIKGTFSLRGWSTTNINKFKGFEFYLREGAYLNIDVNSIKITNKGKIYSVADGTLVPIQSVDNTGNKVIKIVLNDLPLGWVSADFNTETAVVSYDVKIKNTAPSTSIPANELMYVQAIDTTILRETGGSTTAATNNPNKFNVDGSGDINKIMGTMSSMQSLQITAQKDFTVTTAANLNNGPWTSYDYSLQQTVIDLNPEGDAKYQVNVANNSGSSADGYTVLIPIPKAGEATDMKPVNVSDFNKNLHLQVNDFTWTASIDTEIQPTGSLNYTVLYATTYATDKDSAAFVPWSVITNKDDIRMIKIVTDSIIPDGFNEAFSFPLLLSDPDADLHAGLTNIYASRIYTVLKNSAGEITSAGYKNSEPIAIRLKTGVVKGQVFNDTNRNGLKDVGETGRNGVTVVALEAGTTTVIETTTTKTIDGVDGSYAFLGLDKAQNVDIVFTNPVTDDTIRFSPVTSGGSTPTATAIHDKATTSNLTPSAIGFDTINAGLIAPVTVSMNAGTGGSTATATYTRFPGEAITTEPEAVKTGHTFNGWFTASTGGSKVTFPYTVGAA